MVLSTALRSTGQEPASLGDRLNANIWTQDPLPLSAASAAEKGWMHLNASITSSGDPMCDAEYGQRYRLGDRLTPTLMFDSKGRLAGIPLSPSSEQPSFSPLL